MSYATMPDDILIHPKHIATNNGHIADFVIEQGVKDDWNYRKWNSGIMECWRNSSGALGANSTWGTGLYAQTIPATSNYPFEFTEIPALFVSVVHVSSGYNGMVATRFEGNYPSTLNPGAWQFVRGTAGTSGTVTVRYYAIGKYK